MNNKPNIVFLFSDQQRADTMGYAGDPVAITPHLDRLAREGVVFRRGITSSPVCMTARAGIITGKQVHEHGVWAIARPEIRHGQSHVRNVRDAGYCTAVVGKTHLWMHGRGGHASNHLQEMHDWGYVEAMETTGPTESLGTDSIYTDHLAEKGLLDTHREYLRTYLTARGRGGQSWELSVCPLPVEDHLDMFIANTAADWVRDYRKDEPFYLQVNFGGPHDPWDAPAAYRRRYNPDEIPLSIREAETGPVSPLVEMLRQGPGMPAGMSVSENRVMKSYYYGKVTLIDDCIGRVISALEARGMLDNTWIIMSSDHGEQLGDHGLTAKKAFYQGSVNVPFIFRPPTPVPGWQSRALTDHLDIVATIVDIAGAVPLVDSYGKSLLPRLTAGEKDPGAHHHKEAVLCEQGFPPTAFSMVRTDRYKLSMDVIKGDVLDLYDLQEDPSELHNRVNDNALADVKTELIEQHLAELTTGLAESIRALDEDPEWQRFKVALQRS